MQVCNCENPIWLQDRQIHVPCGHCAACEMSKGLSSCSALEQCLPNFKSVFLVTLTYNDEHLPFADWNDDEFAFQSLDVDYHGNYYSSYYSEFCEDSLTSGLLDYCNQHYDGRVPVLSHRDILLFKKRLRKQISKLNEKVFIYVCGEYAPHHFRPHYHLLLCFDTLFPQPQLVEIVSMCWSCRVRYSSGRESYGFVDVRYCHKKGVASYVSKYLNSSINLPKILCGKFRPFRQSFRQSDFRCGYFEFDEQQYFNEPYFEKFCTDYNSGNPTLCRVPSFVESRYYPKHKAFDSVSLQTRCRIAQFCSLFPCFKDFEYYCMNAFDGGLALSFIRDVVMRGVNDVRLVLYKFYLTFRRYVQVANHFGLSLYAYFHKLQSFYSKKELFKLRKFYEFLEDFSLKHSVEDVLALYYDSPVLVDYHRLSDYRTYHRLCHSIQSNNCKTKKRNSYFSIRGWSRPSYGNINPKFLSL